MKYHQIDNEKGIYDTNQWKNCEMKYFFVERYVFMHLNYIFIIRTGKFMIKSMKNLRNEKYFVENCLDIKYQCKTT